MAEAVFLIYATMSTDHTNLDTSVYKLVRNRLPFLKDTPINVELVATYTLEAMYELEPCLRIDERTPDGATSKIGNEDNYTVPQKSLIADLVSIYLLMYQIMANMSGNAGGAGDVDEAGGKFLKSTEAGSVKVEWEQYDINKGSGMFLSGEKLIAMLKKSAIRKGHSLGCIIDINEDSSLAIELLTTYDLPAFRIVTSGCGCAGGTQPKERG